MISTRWDWMDGSIYSEVEHLVRLVLDYTFTLRTGTKILRGAAEGAGTV